MDMLFRCEGCWRTTEYSRFYTFPTLAIFALHEVGYLKCIWPVGHSVVGEVGRYASIGAVCCKRKEETVIVQTALSVDRSRVASYNTQPFRGLALL